MSTSQFTQPTAMETAPLYATRPASALSSRRRHIHCPPGTQSQRPSPVHSSEGEEPTVEEVTLGSLPPLSIQQPTPRAGVVHPPPLSSTRQFSQIPGYPIYTQTRHPQSTSLQTTLIPQQPSYQTPWSAVSAQPEAGPSTQQNPQDVLLDHYQRDDRQNRQKIAQLEEELTLGARGGAWGQNTANTLQGHGRCTDQKPTQHIMVTF